ncbi:MAG: hypothetical protein IJ438_12390 [Clostridia bacterium]|nr:hypothetical protein [Clostridia bacterium]
MFKLAPLFGNGAVLARGKEIRVFGTADEGVRLTAELTAADGTLLAKAACTSAEGRFLLRFPPQRAQTGCTLTVTDGTMLIVSGNVAIGEVYFAGGQSNMELELQNADEGKVLIETHLDADLRYFNVPKKSLWNGDAMQAEGWSHWESIRPGYGKDMSAVAYFFACKLREKLNVPVGIIDCYWGGTSITCWMDEEALARTAEGQRYMSEYAAQCGDKTIEAWQAEEDKFQAEMAEWNGKVDALKKERPEVTWPDINRICGECPWHPPVGPGSPYRPAGLVETMTKRVVPATLTGMLFYQGEEDAWRTEHYEVLLSGYIARMRELFCDDALPFLNVQLPVFINATDKEDNHQWGVLRRAQELVTSQTANTGLACIIDCGEWDNIHPTDKRTPGERLCEQALTVLYGQKGAASPKATGKYTIGGVLTVTLDAPVAITRSGDECAEIAGADRVWHKADIVAEGDKLHLTSEAVPEPVYARYAHYNWCKVRLFGENGLPLAPFVLDN